MEDLQKAFKIVTAKQKAKCRNCGRTIEKGERKLLYQMDHPTYSSSCCLQCLREIQRDLGKERK